MIKLKSKVYHRCETIQPEQHLKFCNSCRKIGQRGVFNLQDLIQVQQNTSASKYSASNTPEYIPPEPKYEPPKPRNLNVGSSQPKTISVIKTSPMSQEFVDSSTQTRLLASIDCVEVFSVTENATCIDSGFSATEPTSRSRETNSNSLSSLSSPRSEDLDMGLDSETRKRPLGNLNVCYENSVDFTTSSGKRKKYRYSNGYME